MDRHAGLHPTAVSPYPGYSSAPSVGPPATTRCRAISHARAGAPGLAHIFARVGYTGPCAQTRRKIPRARIWIPSQAATTLPSGLQEDSTGIWGLGIARESV